MKTFLLLVLSLLLAFSLAAATQNKNANKSTSANKAVNRKPIFRASADQVKQAQLQLQAAGLYNGPTDGMMDPDTRAGLARFQQQNGLRATQTLDQQTLARLNANQATTGFGSSAPSSNQAPPTSAGGNTTGQPINR